MRSTTHRRTQYHDDDDDLSDPRPWETRVPPSKYGSGRDKGAELPMSSVDIKEKSGFDGAEETEVLFDDAQGKWNKGHGAGPGVGGRRGLPPRQRVDGWVSMLPIAQGHFDEHQLTAAERSVPGP